MKTLRSTALLLVLGVQTTAQSSDSCRSLESSVSYEAELTDVSSSYDCDVLGIENSGDGPTLTIRCPSGPPNAYGGSQDFKEFTSTDLGHTWKLSVNHNEPTPFSVVVLPDREFLRAVSNPKVRYWRLQDTGLYLRSEDGGSKWTLPEFTIMGQTKEAFRTHFGASEHYATQFHLLAIDPQNALHLFARITLRPWGAIILVGLGPNSPMDMQVPGVFESLDGGRTWRKFAGAPPTIDALGLSLAKPKLMYAHTKSGIIKSEDGGRTWRTVEQSDLITKQPLQIMDMERRTTELAHDFMFEVAQFVSDPRDPQVVFIVSNKGFYRSVDGGSNWCLLDLGFDGLSTARSMAINPLKSSEIFFATSRGIFFSDDAGRHTRRVYPSQ